jgi:hypothetical protein
MESTKSDVTMTPVNELTTVTILPIVVIGEKSPNPTVVIVSMAHQSAFSILDRERVLRAPI